MAWNGLYVSEANATVPFYQCLFGWQITPHANETAHYDVANSAGKLISSIYELATEFRSE